MNTMTLLPEEIVLDWRKQAATGLPGGGSNVSPPDNPNAAQTARQDVEKAFLDQAYMLIQNKGTPFMKAPYRVGFEIVFKNDENTRLVGIFVFKVDKDLFYATCFFLNGTVKGTDLLYRHTEKQFVPLTTSWSEYLISQADITTGEGIPLSERQFTRHQLELRDLAMPPNSQQNWRKYSAAGVVDPDIKKFWNYLKEAGRPTPPQDSLLRRFITEDGGMDARNKLAATVEACPAFGQALMKCSAVENFAPELKVDPSNPPWEPQLILWTQLVDNPGIKSASAEDIVRGWKLEDFRKEAEVNEHVYVDPAIYLEQISAPGVYEVLGSDGNLRTCLVGNELDDAILDGGCPADQVTRYHLQPQYPNQSTKRIFVELETKESCCTRVGAFPHTNSDPVMGKCTEVFAKCDRLLDTVESGKAYRLVDLAAEAMSEPFYVISTDSSEGGLKQAWYARRYLDSQERRPLVINPEYAGFDPQEKLCGKDIKFIEVRLCEKPKDQERIAYGDAVSLGSRAALDQLIYDNHYKRASLVALPRGEYLMKESSADSIRQSEPLSEMSAVVHATTHFNVRQGLAESLVKQARERGSVSFFFKPFEKQGYNLSFNEWPIFQPTGNNEFQTLEEPRRLDMIQVRRDQPYIHPHRVGDVWRDRGFSSASAINHETPNSLAMLSAQRGVSSLFEHGVVGELVKAYDSTAYVDKYLPDLLTGLDRLGRILFLIYWKPSDFAQDYGEDDQAELENQVLSNFKQLGDLVLGLVQKSNALKTPDTLSGRMP